jgi:hypothetical protein
MALAGTSYDQHVTYRLLELCHPATPWWRRLWQGGKGLIAQELLEAGDPVMSVSEHTKATLLSQLRERILSDPGCGPIQRRAAAKSALLLPSKPSSVERPGHNWSVLAQYTQQLTADYLPNWANEIRGAATPSPTLSPEAAARLIVAHLLDTGCSETFLHRWFTYHIKHDQTNWTLADLIDALDARLAAPPSETEVLVPLTAEVVLPRPIPPGWLTARQARHWRAANIPKAAPVRQHGALLLTVSANDIYTAAELVRERVAALINKFTLGARRDLTVGPHMWIKGVENPLPIIGSPRRTEVHSIERRKHLWSHAMPRNLEAALELMAPLERGPIPAAITGAWAAIECLLLGPGDESKNVAIERIALVTACAHVRAEMTSIAWAHQRATSDSLSADIRAAKTNKERAHLAISAAASGHALSLQRQEDRHGLTRMKGLFRDPHAFVSNVARHLEQTFHGLYRQRNLLSHAGGTDGVALRSTLSRVAPLVAAGVDRIVDAELKEDVRPLELTARARVRLDALRGQPAVQVVDLLG